MYAINCIPGTHFCMALYPLSRKSLRVRYRDPMKNTKYKQYRNFNVRNIWKKLLKLILNSARPYHLTDFGYPFKPFVFLSSKDF